MTRKDFLKTSTAFAAAVGLDLALFAGSAVGSAFKAEDYAALRQELGKFYPPGYCRRECQSKEQVESCRRIGAELDAWAAAHPDFDALDIRRESYLLMRKHFEPFLFTHSPFYFEAGVNGGWSGACPRWKADGLRSGSVHRRSVRSRWDRFACCLVAWENGVKRRFCERNAP